MLFVLGCLVGGQVNRGIYRLAFAPRPIGPWSAPHPQAAPRRWFDRVPVLGWFGLRREADIHGAAFWVRPMAIELALGGGFAALYWYEVTQLGLVRSFPFDVVPAADVLRAQVFAHLTLISLLVVATFIDFDEQTIPDAVTVPGTLAGLTLAAVFPSTLLPILTSAFHPNAQMLVHHADHLLLTAPSAWPGWFDGPRGLGIGLACFWGWCLLLLPKTWWTRSGPVKAVRYCLASILRSRASIGYAAMAVLGGTLTVVVWRVGDPYWPALLTAQLGMAAGAAVVWAVRIIGAHVLGREAMGFGDVTLLAMIGAFLGWQSALIVFLLAPFAGLVVALTQVVLTRRTDIAFGPYLALAAVALIVFWDPLWHDHLHDRFALGLWIPAIVAICLILMTAMLAGWRVLSALTTRR